MDGMETVTADAALPPRVPSRPDSLPGWLPAGSLALGCVLSTLALYLPWEHFTAFNSGVPGNYETADVPVSTAIVANPNYTISDLLFAPIFHRSLATVLAGALWHAAVPLVGIVLLLALFSWRARWLRWPLLAAFALWSALLGIIGVNFLVELRYVTTGSSAELVGSLAHPSWWTRLIIVSGIYTERTAAPAWGWYVLWVGLALAAVGIVWSALRLLRPIPPGATGVHQTHLHRASPRWRVAVLLCTVAFVVWATALLVLPLATVTCAPPTAATAVRAGACTAGVGVYALQAEAIAPLFTTVVRTPTFASAELGMLLYLRTLVLLALAPVAAPFALLAVWRADSPRLRAIACAAWGALVLVVTWTVVFSALAFIAPHHTPGSDFFVTAPLDPAPGVFIVPLAALALAAGLALRWLPLPHGRPATTSV